MKLQDIKNAIIEAERFIHAAREALAEQNTDETTKNWKTGQQESIYKYSIDRGELHGGHLSANVKRKSMDLTRSLSKMRQG